MKHGCGGFESHLLRLGYQRSSRARLPLAPRGSAPDSRAQLPGLLRAGPAGGLRPSSCRQRHDDRGCTGPALRTRQAMAETCDGDGYAAAPRPGRPAITTK
jgi:hypothetical protein